MKDGFSSLYLLFFLSMTRGILYPIPHCFVKAVELREFALPCPSCF